ncbi:uncharacterized protein LTR77_004286 [Saxophila tyrrhenica]|uniref:NmrA-like domain-containing protein n=1 Tax=Saxophila tyrrhenica TaxID=1690608 RepID=A0AAV9PF93_9PEZI|nr:hypothetical protein LTR77_004286 [Saxophila tyrrhenica]
MNSDDKTKQEHVARIKALGIDVVGGDINQDAPRQLATIFSDFDTIINCFGFGAPPGTQLKVANAVLASDCRRYFPWQFGIDYDIIGRDSAQDLFTEQLDVRDLLRSQERLEWVIVSTRMFVSFIFEPAFGVVNAGRDTVTALGSWDNKITVTAPGDIGRFTAEIALACPDVRGVVFTAGDTVSMAQIADLVEKVQGKKVQRIEKTVAQLRSELAQDPSNGMRKYRVVFAGGVGVAWDMDTTFNRQKQISTQSVQQWAQDHLQVSAKSD